MAELLLTGVKEMAARLRAVAGKTPDLAAYALKIEAEAVLANARDNFVPVEDEDLKNSGRVHPVRREAGAYIVTISFGTDPKTAEYAEAVHEYSSAHDPYSWRNAKNPPVKFNPEGRGPKYLEIPVNQAQATLNQGISRAIKMALA
jgi:hypothetical protein